MGSLMAGWDSPTLDPQKVRLERNKSLTREEIEAFKKAHKGGSPHSQEHHQQLQEGNEGAPKPVTPPMSPRLVLRGAEFAVDLDKASKIGDWWTRSNWAFLNEPPVSEEAQKSSHNYTSQFHIVQQQHQQQQQQLAPKRSMLAK